MKIQPSTFTSLSGRTSGCPNPGRKRECRLAGRGSRIMSRLLLTLGLCLALVGCDHASKGIAKSKLAGRSPVTLIAGRVDLAYTENPGMAFSLERVLPARAQAPVLLTGRLIALAFIVVAWARRRRELSPTTAAFAVLAAGALGNILDQVVRGRVVDFIHIHGWPVFNFADAYLVVGVGLLLAASWLPGSRSRPGTTGPRPAA
jgi:signal peptidase II